MPAVGEEAVDVIAVTVTFLRMDRPPARPAPRFLLPVTLWPVRRPTVAFYRHLYDTVGAAHLWWLRRVMPDADLAQLLADPAIFLKVLYRDGQPAGFFELDASNRPSVNLSYFGLTPENIGLGLGYPLLCHAVEAAWALGARVVTVNTCTADHPRALPTYLRSGFQPVRRVREIWDIPRRFGFKIPYVLRVDRLAPAPQPQAR